MDKSYDTHFHRHNYSRFVVWATDIAEQKCSVVVNLTTTHSILEISMLAILNVYIRKAPQWMLLVYALLFYFFNHTKLIVL